MDWGVVFKAFGFIGTFVAAVFFICRQLDKTNETDRRFTAEKLAEIRDLLNKKSEDNRVEATRALTLADAAFQAATKEKPIEVNVNVRNVRPKPEEKPPDLPKSKTTPLLNRAGIQNKGATV